MSEKKPAHRPAHKYSKAIAVKVARMASIDSSLRTMAKHLGISEWIIQQHYADELELGHEIFVNGQHELVAAHAAADWRAAAWLLEKAKPEKFGKKQEAPLLLDNGASGITGSITISLVPAGKEKVVERPDDPAVDNHDGQDGDEDWKV
jgi:hypothetical protein